MADRLLGTHPHGRSHTGAPRLDAVAILCDNRAMCDFDYLANAEAAMKKAVLSDTAHERLHWVRAAQMWQELARLRHDNGTIVPAVSRSV